MRTYKPMATNPVLAVENATVSLGGRRILDDVSVTVEHGEILAVFGHNGAGKSTLLRCILGLVPLQKGSIRLGFASWQRSPKLLLQAGISYLPQGEKIFAHMTVEENLRVLADAAGVERREFESRYGELAEQFTVLHELRAVLAGRLSGGEMQQVALARTFLTRPRLMLLDEPSIGLAPNVRPRAFEAIRSTAGAFGTAVILVEHRVRDALHVAHRACVLHRGALVLSEAAEALLAHPERLRDAII
jgi:ABC-type branched-subunit amino acid transport system ATPase component